MSNFRLKVFRTAALHLNLTKTAELLYISQPAVSRNIKDLETELNIKLFDRVAGKIKLTEAGHIVLAYVESVVALERKLQFSLDALKQQYAGSLRLGASTTIGQYILPPMLAQFHEQYPDIELSLLNDNTDRIENALLNNEIDIAIVEGLPQNSFVKYIPFIKDEIVAIIHTSQVLSQRDEISIDDLKTTPLVLREEGSGSLAVITDKLKEYGIKLPDMNIVLHLGSTESIKSYLAYSNTMALISIHAVRKEISNGEFKIIDICDLEFDRTFYFIHTYGQLSGLPEMFLNFTQRSITNGYRP